MPQKQRATHADIFARLHRLLGQEAEAGQQAGGLFESLLSECFGG